MRRPALLLVLLLAPLARADEALGMQLVREAQARLAEHDAEGALQLLDRARTEWPGSDVVACTRGDALLAAGRPDEALLEYERALSGGHAHHARFNRGVAQAEAGEQLLAEAAVPADVAALPEGPQPGMLQAVQAGGARLEQARAEFLRALDQQDEPAARESVGALNRRLDALAAIEDELKRREEPPPGEGEDQDQPQDSQPPGDQPPPEGEPQDEPQDQPPQDQPPSDQPQEPPQDQPSEPQEDEARPEESQEPPPDGQQQATEPEQAPQPAHELSEEEVERLLDRLAQLEAEARARAKAREAASRRAVEKDW